MKIRWLMAGTLLLGACSHATLRCDSHLQPINAPTPPAVPPAPRGHAGAPLPPATPVPAPLPTPDRPAGAV